MDARFAACAAVLVAEALVLVPAVSAAGPMDGGPGVRPTAASIRAIATDTTPTSPQATPSSEAGASAGGPRGGGGVAEGAPAPGCGGTSGAGLRQVPGLGVLRPGGRSVVEAAWGDDGPPDVLHVIVAGVEPEPVAGLRVRLEVMGKWGRDSVPVASTQGLSSLDAEDFGGLGEVWVEWRMVEGVRLKAGRVDGNTEYAAAEAAAPFANPSFGLSPALGLLPSYPTPAPSLNVFVRPVPGGAELGAGVYRVADGSWSVMGQVARSGGLPVRWAAGVAAPVGPGSAGGARAAAGYLIVESGPVTGPAVFGKVAAAGELLHLAGGLTVPLPVAGGQAGLAGSLVSDPGHPSGDELVTEAFVAIRPFPWLVVQPDLQLRLAPDASPRAGALLRIVVER